MGDPLAWIDDQLNELAEQGLERLPAIRHSCASARRLQLDGRQLINFGSNDYLGLAADEQLRRAAVAAIKEYGWGSAASPLLGGRSQLHAQLEQELASFLECDAALVFPTGYAANVGCLTSLVGPGDTVFSDSLNHASIIDGCRLSRANVEVFAHADVDALDQLLTSSPRGGRRLIVTDSLFSMHGDVAPLPALRELASRHDAMLMVDEAHATGVFGACGRGLCEQAGVRPDIHVGTLSKALGSHGGFVAGGNKLIRWLFNRARPYFFSTASPPAIAAASLAALDMVRQQPERRQVLLQSAAFLRDRLNGSGWATGDSCSQIVPIFVGQPDRAMQLSQKLLDRGVFAPGIRPPSVPQGQALLRISLSTSHSRDDIEHLLLQLDGDLSRP